MSQHWLSGKINDKAVEILIGWDEPLKHFFLTIDPDGEPPIYSNLDANPDIAFSHSLEDYQAVLDEHGVTGVKLDPNEAGGLYQQLINDKLTGKMN